MFFNVHVYLGLMLQWVLTFIASRCRTFTLLFCDCWEFIYGLPLCCFYTFMGIQPVQRFIINCIQPPNKELKFYH